jgi:hypothetical protein
MATKKPLVYTSGQFEQIQSGDTVDPGNLGTGTRDGSKFLRDDGTWQVPAGGSSSGPTIGKVYAQQRGFFCQ